MLSELATLSAAHTDAADLEFQQCMAAAMGTDGKYLVCYDSDQDASPRPSALLSASSDAFSIRGSKILSLVVPHMLSGFGYCFRVTAYNSEGQVSTG